MRTVKIGKKTVPVQPLVYRDLKYLRQKTRDGDANFDDVEFVLEKTFSKAIRGEIDKLPAPTVLDIYKAVMDETVGNKEEEKNS